MGNSQSLENNYTRDININKRVDPVYTPDLDGRPIEVIYILKLEHGYWYIGRTTNIERRYMQHTLGKGAKWTFLHRPLAIHETIPLKSEQHEDEITIEYMKKYGMSNVRGGKFCQVELKDYNIREIEKKIRNHVVKKSIHVENTPDIKNTTNFNKVYKSSVDIYNHIYDLPAEIYTDSEWTNNEDKLLKSVKDLPICQLTDIFERPRNSIIQRLEFIDDYRGIRKSVLKNLVCNGVSIYKLNETINYGIDNDILRFHFSFDKYDFTKPLDIIVIWNNIVSSLNEPDMNVAFICEIRKTHFCIIYLQPNVL